MLLQVRAYGRRIMDELEVGLASAWHGEAFARTHRLPDLEKMVSRRRTRRRGVDRAFTVAESRRWAAQLAGKTGDAQVTEVAHG